MVEAALYLLVLVYGPSGPTFYEPKATLDECLIAAKTQVGKYLNDPFTGKPFDGSKVIAAYCVQGFGESK